MFHQERGLFNSHTDTLKHKQLGSVNVDQIYVALLLVMFHCCKSSPADELYTATVKDEDRIFY